MISTIIPVKSSAQSWKQIIIQGSSQDLDRFRSQVSSAVVDAIPGYYLLTVPASADLTKIPGLLHSDNAPVTVHQNTSPTVTTGSLPPAGQSFQFYESLYLNQPAVSQISLAQALRQATGAGIRVAIIDTGVDEHNALLQGALLPGRNYVGSSPIPDELNDPVLAQTHADILDQTHADILDQTHADILDGASLFPDYGHGTMMAGLVHLVAPGAQIIPLKAFDANGASTEWNIVRAVYDAVAMGADIINMSFSATQESQILKSALDFAADHGVVLIAAAGNDNKEQPTYPAAFDHVLGISALDSSDQKASFSNYGRYVALSAPGVNIISTYPGDTTHPAGRWAMASGTSDAAPLVAGVAALVKQRGSAPGLIDHQVESGTDSLTVPQQYRDKLGAGALDAYKAISSANH